MSSFYCIIWDNGFYTADGYCVNYPLKYKHKFRKIISKELQKNITLKRGFDEWGNRCYMFINQIGYNFIRKKNDVFPIVVELNSSALLDLGVKYIFSSYEIENYNKNNLSYLGSYTTQDSPWKIYLYKVIK